jgi:hypothetical protein
MFTPVIPTPTTAYKAGHVFEKTQYAEIANAYKENGFVIFRAMTPEQCKIAVVHKFNEVIKRQKWKASIMLGLELRDDNGNIIDTYDPANTDKVFKILTGPLSVERRKQFEDAWPLHIGFGACCDHENFNLDTVWEVRQDPDIHKIAAKILKTLRLWVSLDRSSALLPGQAKDAFLHIDQNPMELYRRILLGETEEHNVQGKVSYNGFKIHMVAGSQKPENMKEILEVYSENHDIADGEGTMFAIDPKKDLLNMHGMKQCIDVPPGCMIMWSESTFHGPTPNPIKDGTIWFGHYQAYTNIPYSAEQHLDRIKSYETGERPNWWQNGGKIHFYPARFQNLHGVLKTYHDKLDEGHPMIAFRPIQRKDADGNPIMVPHLNELPRSTPYEPAKLSLLGEQLLGRVSWDADPTAVVDPTGPVDPTGVSGCPRETRKTPI